MKKKVMEENPLLGDDGEMQLPLDDLVSYDVTEPDITNESSMTYKSKRQTRRSIRRSQPPNIPMTALIVGTWILFGLMAANQFVFSWQMLLNNFLLAFCSATLLDYAIALILDVIIPQQDRRSIQRIYFECLVNVIKSLLIILTGFLPIIIPALWKSYVDRHQS